MTGYDRERDCATALLEYHFHHTEGWTASPLVLAVWAEQGAPTASTPDEIAVQGARLRARDHSSETELPVRRAKAG